MTNLPAALMLEIKLNWFLLNNPPLFEEGTYHPEYYNPTRQIFKFRDDAISYYLRLPGFADGEQDTALLLLALSNNVRFVNLQVDELLAFRFGDPVMFAKALSYVRKHPEVLRTPAKIHRKHRDWFEALAQRHWAIVNEGFWKRLRPSLIAIRERLEGKL